MKGNEIFLWLLAAIVILGVLAMASASDNKSRELKHESYKACLISQEKSVIDLRCGEQFK